MVGGKQVSALHDTLLVLHLPGSIATAQPLNDSPLTPSHDAGSTMETKGTILLPEVSGALSLVGGTLTSILVLA